jgi:phosphoribosylcarboxyaminoimidazole (NCAIR) mutase
VEVREYGKMVYGIPLAAISSVMSAGNAGIGSAKILESRRTENF